MRDLAAGSGEGRGRRREAAFYGWWVVAFCAIAQRLTVPGQTLGISVFIDPIMGSLDLTRSEVSTAYMIGTLVSAATMPRVGSLVDRFGSRASMALIGGVFGVVLAGAAGITGLITLTIAFIFLRLCGQGALSLVSTTAVAPWFVRRRGLAIGIVSAVGSAIISIVPIGSAAVIRAVGWRQTWLILAAVVWLVLLPIALRGIVDRPEDLGQRPDGDPEPPTDPGGRVAKVARRSLERRAAMRTPMFWAIAGSMGVTSSIGTGLNFHQIDLLGEQGLSPIEAAANYVPQTVGVLVSTLIVSALVDHVRERWLLIASLAMLAGAMLMVPFVQPGVLAIVYGLLLGSASSSARATEAAITPRFYGLSHLGSIRGVLRLFNVAASAVGPLIVALGRSATGSYGGMLVLLLIVPATVGVLTLLAPRPEPVD